MIIRGDILLYEDGIVKILGIVVTPRARKPRNSSYEIHDMYWMWSSNPRKFVGLTQRLGDAYMQRVGNLDKLGVDSEAFLSQLDLT